MKNIYATVIFLVAMMLSACVFDSGEKWRDGPYFVLWIDTPDNLTLNYEVGDGGSIMRIDKRIIAVGSNNRYVVVKQQPHTENTSTYYYIIDRLKDHKYADSLEFVVGPMSKNEYELKSDLLKLPEFTQIFN